MSAVVCPQCGAPQHNIPYVEGERGVNCDFCGWSGSSTDLIYAEKEVQDPRKFDLLSNWIIEDMGAKLSSELAKRGFIPNHVIESAKAGEVQNLYNYFNRIVRTFVAAIMQGVLDPNILETETHSPVDTEFLTWFNKFEVLIIKGMIDLGVVKEDRDFRNVRYITKLMRRAVSKLYEELNVQSSN